ncbi:MAG: ribosome silencing factor [Kiritimatiellae bacterium]|nr:ribosome silencing factor [Kiritimatiellia bacterium]
MEASEEVEIIVRALEASKAEDVKVYDVRGRSSLTDFFVVATGSAAPHLKSLVSNARQAMRDAGVKSNRLSGDPECGWIVADFIDVVVHAFSREARAYYAIEKLWA